MALNFSPSHGLPMREPLSEGGTIMTTQEKMLLEELYKKGLGYKKIANITELSVNSVKSHCKRHIVIGNEILCPCCAKPIAQIPKHKKRRFCSDDCRKKWWRAHPEAVRREKCHELICTYCGQKFQRYGKDRRYCSRACYANARRKECVGNG